MQVRHGRRIRERVPGGLKALCDECTVICHAAEPIEGAYQTDWRTLIQQAAAPTGMAFTRLFLSEISCFAHDIFVCSAEIRLKYAATKVPLMR